MLPLAGVALWLPPLVSLHRAAAYPNAVVRGAVIAADEALMAARQAFPPFERWLLGMAVAETLERADVLARSAGDVTLREHLRRLDGHLDSALAHSPDDLRTHLARAQLAAQLARRFADSAALCTALGHARRAHELSPRRREPTFLLAALLLERGEPAAGLAVLRRSVEELPTYGGGWWRLALAHEQLGQRTEARRLAREALARRVVVDGDGAKVLRRLADPALNDRRSVSEP